GHRGVQVQVQLDAAGPLQGPVHGDVVSGPGHDGELHLALEPAGVVAGGDWRQCGDVRSGVNGERGIEVAPEGADHHRDVVRGGPLPPDRRYGDADREAFPTVVRLVGFARCAQHVTAGHHRSAGEDDLVGEVVVGRDHAQIEYPDPLR